MSIPLAAPLTPAQITWRSPSSFLVSFAFLTRERRRGLTAVYAFCRVVDDAADDCPTVEEGREQLAFWRRELELAFDGEPTTAVGRGVQSAAETFGVAHEHLELVLDGVATDLEGGGFDDLAGLEDYCFRVASAVGLACLPVFGVRHLAAAEYARSLGLALQLTNVLRDLGKDALRGRIYAPRDHLAAAGVEPTWLAGSGPAEAYAQHGPIHNLVLGLSQRAWQHFGAAEEALREQWRRPLLAPEIMGAVYRELLQRIDRRGGEIRGEAPRISTWRKLVLAWRTNRRSRSTAGE